jgi:hypothetical protein
MRFSERHGYTPVRTLIQREDVDDGLRNRLWNCATVFFLESSYTWLSQTPELDRLCLSLWNNFYKAPIDAIPKETRRAVKEIRNRYFESDWRGVYDFIEFLSNAASSDSSKYQKACNAVLESELSAYRFVDGKLVEITSGAEIAAIEEALQATQPLASVNAHLQSALDKLADRDSPDYRNSIKESISAVEALCNLIVGSKASLGDALKKLGDAGVEVHPALEGAFTKLYGYTSDANGIRHALKLDDGTSAVEDATFMLAACSSFISYLLAKSAKGGLAL